MTILHDVVLDALPAHVALLDQRGVIVATNAAWREFGRANGMQSDGFGVGTSYTAVCRRASGECSDVAFEIANAIDDVLAGRRGRFAREYDCHAPDRPQWYRFSVSPATLESGRGAVVMHVEVTDTAALTQALREEEQRYRALFERHPQPMYVADVHTWQFLAVNDAAIRRYGYSAEEFAGLTLLDIRPPEDAPHFRAEMSELDDAVRNAGRWRHLLRDGTVITVDISTQHLNWEGRDAIIVLALDVTEQLAAERALRDSLAAQSRLADELSEERRRLLAAQRVARVGDWELDLDRRSGRWSEEVYRIFGRAATDQPLPMDLAFEWIHPDDRADARDALLRSVARPDKLFSHQHRVVTPEGVIKTVEQHWRIEVDCTGKGVRMIGTSHDITTQSQALAALQRSEERFRLVAEAAHVAIWDWDLTVDSVWWNAGFEAVFGVREGLHAAHHDWWTERLHPDDRAHVVASLDAAIAGAALDWAAEYRIQRADGAYAVVSDHAQIVRNASGVATRMIGGTTDVGARRSAEERIIEQAALLDAAHDAIMVKDMDDRIVYWNLGAERIFGWRAAEAIGQRAQQLFGVDPAPYGVARAALLAHDQWEGELVKRTRDGIERQVEVRWTLLRWENGEPRAVLGITLDVTERKRLEAQFLRAQRLESIGTLAGGIAHDLNNVLAPIMMSIELLRLGETSAERQETLDTIEASAQRGADMVRQVLSFARGTRGERLDIDAALVVRDVAKIARDTFPKDITIEMRSAPDLWLVRADPTQLHQVLMNLAVNARDAMPRGGTLEIALANAMLDETYAAMNPGSSIGAHVALTIADTGDGIPREVQDRLFEPFFTTKPQGKGTGLGLSTVHSIVRSHGGSVTVYSEPGKGAQFVVMLPATARSGTPEGEGVEEPQLPRGAGEMILVVDDEDAIRSIIGRTLDRFGYRVLQAANGAEAVARYLEHRQSIAAVITDMAMPVMDGASMAAALRAIDPGARIIGSSGMLSDEGLEQLRGAGVLHFVPKPYTAESLLTTVAHCLAP